ncbi:MAG: ComF family protein [Bacteroidota bacterium]
MYEFPKTDFHKNPGNAMEVKFYGKIDIKNAFAFLKFSKKGKVQKLLHLLKYQDRPDVGEFLGQWYGNELQKSGMANQFDLVIPIPLHEQKLRKRGYNQSEAFAKGLAESMSVRMAPDLVKRVQNNDTQTRKGRLQRWQNVDGIFEVREKEQLSNKRVLLVDDIVTTGSTLEACARTIADAGAEIISVAAIAVAQ